MLAGVALLYILLYIFKENQTQKALISSWEVLKEIIPILAVVVFFAGAINYYFNPKQLAKHLGEEGGAKGWFISLFAGILSHGPMYAWYPMIEDLKHHGLRDGYITAFFYARAVKIPILPVMIHYFGWQFALFLSLYTVLGAWVQGILVDIIEANLNWKKEKR